MLNHLIIEDNVIKFRVITTISLAMLVAVLPLGKFVQGFTEDDAVMQVSASETTMISGVAGFNEIQNSATISVDSYVTDDFDDNLSDQSESTLFGYSPCPPGCYYDPIMDWCVCE